MAEGRRWLGSFGSFGPLGRFERRLGTLVAGLEEGISGNSLGAPRVYKGSKGQGRVSNH